MKYPIIKNFKIRSRTAPYIDNLLADCQKQGLTIAYVDEKKDAFQAVLNSEEERQTLELMLLYHLLITLKRIDEETKGTNYATLS